MRTCSKCRIEKNENEFSKGCYYCKPCALLYVREQYQKNPEIRKGYARDYYHRNKKFLRKQARDNYQNDPDRKKRHHERNARWARENPQSVKHSQQKPTGRFSHARQTARQRGLDWKLERQQYVDLVIQPCTYCGEVTVNYGVGLDRIDNSKGYEMGNVQPCCGNCNQLRGHRLTVGETKAAMDAIMAYRKNR